MRRAQVLASAIRTLRRRMNASQEALADAMGSGTDVGSISRWERAEFSPGPSKRKRLAAIARKNGCGDLIAAFEQPVYEWKLALLSERDRHWLALFELVLLNQPPGERIGLLVPRREYARLIKDLRAVVRAMKTKAARSGRPILKMSDGQVWVAPGICVVSDEQVEAWQRELQGPRVQATHPEDRKTDRPGLVVRYNDGHVEMYRDWKEYEKAMREQAQESEE